MKSSDSGYHYKLISPGIATAQRWNISGPIKEGFIRKLHFRDKTA